jgi:hypothetical protein
MKNKMRKIFILLFTIISITSSAQDISKGIDSMRKQLNKDMAAYDSSAKISDSLIKAYSKRNDSAAMARYNEQNTRNLVSFMNEREQKQKKDMWIRLTFGGMLLIVGILGMLRKRKKKESQ